MVVAATFIAKVWSMLIVHTDAAKTSCHCSPCVGLQATHPAAWLWALPGARPET
jgi:hypothetical protein